MDSHFGSWIDRRGFRENVFLSPCHFMILLQLGFIAFEKPWELHSSIICSLHHHPLTPIVMPITHDQLINDDVVISSSDSCECDTGVR